MIISFPSSKAKMGSEFEIKTFSPPKLFLYSLPARVKEPSGTITPPIHTAVSVPFKWEEAPGKPRPCPNTTETATHESKPKTARCLELPPRLFADQAKVANLPSPTTVLDGPDTGRLVSHTLSFQKTGSFRAPDICYERTLNKEKLNFGSNRWGSFRRAGRVVQGSFDLSSAPVPNGGGGGNDGGGGSSKQVKIKRVRREGSFLSLYQAKSHNVLASIYESFKHVVPWKRGQDKMMKKS